MTRERLDRTSCVPGAWETPIEMSLEMGLAIVAAVLALLAVAGVLVLGRARRPSREPGADGQIERLSAEVARLGQVQERLRVEAQQGREDALRGLADVAQGLQGRVATAQRELSEVKAVSYTHLRAHET